MVPNYVCNFHVGPEFLKKKKSIWVPNYLFYIKMVIFHLILMIFGANDFLIAKIIKIIRKLRLDSYASNYIMK